MARIAINHYLRASARDPLARALMVSLVAHVLLFTVLEMALRTGLLQGKTLLDWARDSHPEPNLALAAQRKQEPPQERDIPLLFVDVDPNTATAEEPKDAQYYSALNTHAANPNPTKNLDVPQIDGTQTRVPKTQDVPRERAQPLQPVAPPKVASVEELPQPPTPAQLDITAAKPVEAPVRPPETLPENPAPAGGKPIGDLAMAKPTIAPHPNPGDTPEAPPQPRVRPRTLASAKQLPNEGGMAGLKMRQDGGVKNAGVQSTLDVKNKIYGAYDAALLAAIEKHWNDLLADNSLANRVGKVVLSFRLRYDGTVTDFKAEEYDVGEVLAIICQRAISDPAPFGAWPGDMRRTLGADYREIRITFYYN